MSAVSESKGVDAGAPQTRLKSRVGFGFGDFGVSIGWNVTNTFVLFYYTDAVGLPNAVAGAIVMIAMIWDGITDPLVGLLASWTRTRWGRYRPYMLFGSVPLAISLALMFYKPDLEGTALFVFMTATHLLFRTCYTTVAIPYSALIARLTKNADERSSLAVWRLLFAATSGALVAALTLDLSKTLGGGDLALGFSRVAMIYAVISVIAIIVSFAVTDEGDYVKDAEEERPAFRQILFMLSKNTAFWLLFIISFIGATGSTIGGKSGLYFLKYNLEAEHLIGIFAGGFALVIAASVPVWSAVAKRKGKKFVLVCAYGIAVFVNLTLFMFSQSSPAIILPIMILGASGAAATFFSISSAIPDTVEYGEWKSGVRAEAIVYGIMTFAQKVSLGIAVGILGLALDFIGFRANEEQSPETIEGFRYLISLVPMGFAMICLYLTTRFNLDQDRHARIVRDIEAWKASDGESHRYPSELSAEKPR